MKKSCLLLYMALLFPLVAGGQKVREAYFAGTFYDARPKVLSEQINTYLRQAREKARISENPCALIVPHAGYSCSGPVAAYAYCLVEGLDFETVVIVGTSHQGVVRGCSIYPEGGYKTPLGVVPVDSALSRKISQISGFSYNPGAHQAEHSIEVQIPFIQKVLPEAKIVPILMGAPSPSTISTLAKTLVQALRGTKTLVVASTDLSHYYPKDKANAADSETLSLIKSFQTDSLTGKLQKGENIMCGGGGVVSILLYARALGEPEIELLHYADSSSTCGSPDEVVGYAAAAVFVHKDGQAGILSEKSKKELLRLARTSVERFVKKQEVFDYSPQNPELLAQRGAFVTLKKKDVLRGCIGFIEPAAPLYQTVIQASIFASYKDPRFTPVVSEEIDDLDIEISVLTPLRKISDPTLVEVGRHGLFVNWQGQSGLLLPQVPVENGWSRVMFLEQVCLKAGLPKNAWKSGAGLFVFEADVFRQ